MRGQWKKDMAVKRRFQQPCRPCDDVLVPGGACAPQQLGTDTKSVSVIRARFQLLPPWHLSWYLGTNYKAEANILSIFHGPPKT